MSGEREQRHEPFSGTGSVLMLDLLDVTASDNKPLSPDDLATVMQSHCDHVSGVITRHGGTVYQHIGVAIAAFWFERDGGSGHARSAVAAASELLKTPYPRAPLQRVRYQLDISIGSGAIAGSHFGPIQQFQIIGMAHSTAKRLAQASDLPGAGLRISQFTRDLLADQSAYVEVGVIARGELEALRVFAATSGAS